MRPFRSRRVRPAMRPLLSRPPDLEDVERIARAQLAVIPEPFRRHFRDVVVHVEEFCDEETEREMELESPFDLLGLYRGVSLAHKSVTAGGEHIDMIFLYRRAILDYWCETGDDLGHIVRHVLIHELGHHLGLSDDDMERIEGEA